MKRSGRKQEWSVTMFTFGVLVFFPPLVSLFDVPILVMGFPLPFLVLFGVWAVMIIGIWLGSRRSALHADRSSLDDDGPREPTFDQASISPHDQMRRR